jgi:RNA polymerase sigma-70 factor, ECF subfamily
MQTDEEIAELIQSGKTDLFGVIIDRYEDKMKRYSRKFLLNPDDINDIVQEIFIKAYTNIQSFDIKRKFSSWIYRIAHNHLVNYLRKKRVILPLLNLDTFFPHSIKTNETEDEINRQEIKDSINKSLDQLNIKYKEPLILYYFQELSYKEISDILKIPVSTVGIRIKRAKEQIKNIWTLENK